MSRAKTPLLREAKKQVGSRKTPTEKASRHFEKTPVGVNKTGSVVLKPWLKDMSVFGITPVGIIKNRVGVLKTPGVKIFKKNTGSGVGPTGQEID